MSVILIGSRALKLKAPRVFTRPCSDIDLIASREDAISLKGDNEVISESDNHIAFKIGNDIFDIGFDTIPSNRILIDLVSEDIYSTKVEDFLVPSLDVLYTIKKSHRFKKNSKKFWITLFDYHLMKKLGATVPDKYQEFLKLREQETYTNTLPKLNVTKGEFFSDDNIRYVYDHDWIHRVIALGDRPAYREFLDGEVKVSKSKFLHLDYETQLRSFIEEACVLAVERCLVHHPEKNPKEVWLFALSKVLSSISSGWWREFGYENALDIINRYPENYFNRFQKAAETNPIYYTQ